MPTLATVVVHGTLTARSHYRYQFTPKHHGADQQAAQWLPALTLEEEFAVFDDADEHDLTDDAGELYGLRRDGEGGLLPVGVWDEQIAEFPFAGDGQAWRGYPGYPLVEMGPANRRGERSRPARVVFDKMLRAGLISRSQRQRLLKGRLA